MWPVGASGARLHSCTDAEQAAFTHRQLQPLHPPVLVCRSSLRRQRSGGGGEWWGWRGCGSGGGRLPHCCNLAIAGTHPHDDRWEGLRVTCRHSWLRLGTGPRSPSLLVAMPKAAVSAETQFTLIWNVCGGAALHCMGLGLGDTGLRDTQHYHCFLRSPFSLQACLFTMSSVDPGQGHPAVPSIHSARPNTSLLFEAR